MLDWKDVIPYVVSRLGTDPQHIACILKFLHVLPEEVTEGRKINLSVCSVETPPIPDIRQNDYLNLNTCLIMPQS